MSVFDNLKPVNRIVSETGLLNRAPYEYANIEFYVPEHMCDERKPDILLMASLQDDPYETWTYGNVVKFDIYEPTEEEVLTLIDAARTNIVFYSEFGERKSVKNCTPNQMLHIYNFIHDTRDGKSWLIPPSTYSAELAELAKALYHPVERKETNMGHGLLDTNYLHLEELSFTYDLKPVSGLKPTKVIFYNPATVVFWNDGTKTIVKCSKNDIFTKEGGFAAALAKKMYGNGGLKKIMKEAKVENA